LADCLQSSVVGAIASVGVAVAFHIRAIGMERRAEAPDVYADDVERSFYRAHVEAENSEKYRCKMLAEKYKVAGYFLVLSAGILGAAPVIAGWCWVLFPLGAISLLVPGFVLFTILPELLSSYRFEWDVVHYNKWTQEILPTWPGYLEFFRQRRRGVAAQLKVTAARRLLILALREVYGMVMTRARGGQGGAGNYDFARWEQSIDRLSDSLHSAENLADLSAGQVSLVDDAVKTSDVTKRMAVDLTQKPVPARKMSDYSAVWHQAWLTLDSIAKARQALGDVIQRSELDDLRVRLVDGQAVT